MDQMYRPEVEKILDKLSKLRPIMRSNKGLEKAWEDSAQCEPAENELYSLLRRVPGLTDDKEMMILYREQVKDRGEDSYLAVREGEHVFLGVFDGCGGSGGKTYASFGGHTGAWMASRAATIAARNWLLSAVFDGDQEKGDLTACVSKALHACKSSEPAGQLLLGSLSKEFPTTVAAFRMEMEGHYAHFYWCGDSRCYLLDAEGLHQVTTDDAVIQDAMRNLREDAPMTNVASASQPFQIHEKRLKVSEPSVIFAATDGCFGYLPSPMAFEKLLLETMASASSMEEWRSELDGQIGLVSGDDYTLTAWPHRFNTFREMKQTFHDRLIFIEENFLQAESEEALFDQWEVYKPNYESMMTDKDAYSERGKE